MRKNRIVGQKNEFSILTLDDDEIMTLTLQSYFQGVGFRVDMENDPLKAIERIRTGQYDILLLDFLMRPICGDEVVRQIREFNRDLFIILLTGHKSMAPPIKTVRELDIQGYYEKSDRFDQLELLVESCVKSIRQMRTIRSYRDGLQRILDRVPALSRQTDTEQMLSTVLEQVSALLPCQNAYIYLDLSVLGAQKLCQDTSAACFCGIGHYTDNPQAGRDGLHICDTQESAAVVQQGNQLTVPLFSENHQRFGVLTVELSDNIRAESIQLFEVYSKQVSAMVNSQIFRSLLQVQNHELVQAYADLHENYIGTVDAMRQMVDAKDIYTRGHSDRVSFYAVHIAEKLQKDDAYRERIRIAGLFHDIGKVGIPDSILLKNSKLTPEEYARIQQHPTLGRKVLSSISAFRDILDIVESHHERYDGHGYPHGLQGADIPEEARIIGVADAFDAMTSKRAYRNNLTPEEAIQELKNGRGTQFDADVVDAFLEILQNFQALQDQLAWTYADVPNC